MNLPKIFAATIFLLISALSSGAADNPRWVGESNDPALWTLARGILKDELAPVDPRIRRPYKYIARILRTDDFALVLIGERPGKSYHQILDYFKAFTIDLTTRRKSAVADKGFYLWRFVQWASLDASPIPDTLFEFESCVECESYNLLGSFQFDAKEKQWTLRGWPEDGREIPIGTDGQHGDQEDYHIACLYAVRDLTNDGRDDIATYCRTIGEKTGMQAATATLYTVTPAGPEKRELGSDAAKALRQQLCTKNLKKEIKEDLCQ